MVRYLLFVSYIGTRYRGAQKSVANGPILDPDSIQGALECGLIAIFNRIVKEQPTATCSSRTDGGVHALRSAFHIDIPNDDNTIYCPNSIVQYLNRYMTKSDHDIRALECIPVNDRFTARHRAISRTYMYRCMVPKHPDENRIPITERNQTAYIPYRSIDEKFDIEKVQSGLRHFQGVKNFETFAAKSADRYEKEKVYVRRLHRFTVEESTPFMPLDPLSQNFDFYTFIVKSKSFLYNQVRRMVGSLLALGKGQITEKELREMIEVPNRHSWNSKVTPASPSGLYLMDVEYDKNELEGYKIFPEKDQSYYVLKNVIKDYGFAKFDRAEENTFKTMQNCNNAQ